MTNHGVLASWDFTDEEWRTFLAGERRRSRQRVGGVLLRLLLAALVLSLMVGLAVSPRVVPLVLTGLGLTLAIVLFAEWWRTRRLASATVRSAVLYRWGVELAGVRSVWSSPPYVTLDRIELDEHAPLLVAHCERHQRRAAGAFQIHVPVPAARADEARALATALMRARPDSTG